MKDTQPNPDNLFKHLKITLPLIGFYDAPDPEAFHPLLKPQPGDCVFTFFEEWANGKTVHISTHHYGCGGAGRWMCGVETRSREEFIQFLVDEEGLKSSRQLMERWIDVSPPYDAQNPHILIGPLRKNQWEYAKSITFFVNPDQLSVLMLGAQYNSAPEDPPPVIAPFGSGCMLLLPFKDEQIPQASVGSTDIAMRQHLPPELLSFTVTRPMFRNLCALDERSFLEKSFLKRLKEARGVPKL